MKRLILICLFFMSMVYANALDISISKSSITLGEPICITVRSAEKIRKSHIGFDQKKFNLFLKSNRNGYYNYIAYIGASRKLDRSSLPLDIHVVDMSGKRFFKSYRITLNYPELPIGRVVLSKKKENLSKDTKSINIELVKINKAFNLRTKTSYLSDHWLQPVNGTTTSPFGAVREYNGTYSRSHAGVDFGCAKGTSIVAPSDGVVVVSESFNVHGNTVMLDHGFGVVTIYNHLNSRLVRKGNIVKKGDVIGTVGDTGVATGPHLHWGLSVQGVRVDPLLFMRLM